MAKQAVSRKAPTSSRKPKIELLQAVAGAEQRPTRTEIARRAFELYLSRGGSHGSDVSDWLCAERELTTASR
jgi:hypothetical protein